VGLRRRGNANLRKESLRERERIYIARKKERIARRKTIKIKEYIILGCDSVV
jgi:hypothetical protein